MVLTFTLLLPFGLKAAVPGGYVVTNDVTSATVGTYNDLATAVAAVPATNVPHTITLTGNDPAIGTVVSVPANKDITLTSGAGGPYTITQATAGQRHLAVPNNVTLTLTNIILDGANTAGGITFNGSSANLTLNSGGVIQNCSASAMGGGVNKTAAGTFTMNSGSVIQNCSTYNDSGASSGGGGVYMTAGTFNMLGGVIQNCSANRGGGVFLRGTGTFNMYGGAVIQDCNATVNQGGGVFLYGSGTFTMYDGNITGNTAQRGAGVGAVGASGVVTSHTIIMHGGEITNNTAGVYGGGVMTVNTFTMYDGVISGNKAPSGGGVQLSGNSSTNTFTMYDGVISGNEASSGGGVHLAVSAGGIFMTGGEISGNTASGDGGGIYTQNYSYANPAVTTQYRHITISGSAVVSGNFSSAPSAPPSNYMDFNTRSPNPFPGILLDNDNINYINPYLVVIYVANNGKSEPNYYQSTGVTTGPVSVNAVSLATTGFSAPAYGPNFKGWNTAANGSGAFYAPGDPITISTDTTLYAQWGPARYLVYADADTTDLLSSHNLLADAVAAVVTFSAGSGDAYTIVATEDDLAMGAAAVTIPATESITLTSGDYDDAGGGFDPAAGGAYTITMDQARHIILNGELTLIDIVLDGANTAGGIQVNAGGDLTIDSGGVIQNCVAPNGVYNMGGGVLNSGTLTMNAGSRISGNETTVQGGGVFSTGTFTMSGGEISGNTATNSGGGVKINGGTFDMTGGEISGNTSSQGGVSISDCTFTMTGGEISGNTAGSSAGVDVNFNSTFIMSGGKISGNTATINAGGVGVVPGTTFTMTDGEISGNKALSNMGGGVMVAPNGIFDMSDGLITGNFAGTSGGGVYNYNGTFSMSGGYITGDTATMGGGVYVTSAGTFEMTGGEITGNEATTDGGGIYTEDYDYTNPAATTAYANIAIANAAVVSGNTSSATQAPPTNAAAFATRLTGLGTFDGRLLNNDEINYYNPYIALDLKVFLESVTKAGPVMTNYIQVPGDYMTCILSEPRLPLADPYGMGVTCPDIQDTLGVAGKVVDWIQVMILKNVNVTTPPYSCDTIETRALLLKPDGSVVDVDGGIPRFTPQAGPVHIVVKHRSHLAVMSQTVANFGVDVMYDFSVSGQAYQSHSNDPMVSKAGVYCMWTGDVNGDDVIDATDQALVRTDMLSVLFDQYINTDLNMNGITDNVEAAIMVAQCTSVLYSPMFLFAF